MRSWLPVLLALWICLALAALVWLRLRRVTVRELRRKTRDELEGSVFRYEDGYFRSLGPEHPDVQEFKRLVEARDLRGLQSHWSRLSRSFLRLERQAGHRGRPLILDYYHWYDLDLRELARRGPGPDLEAPGVPAGPRS